MKKNAHKPQQKRKLIDFEIKGDISCPSWYHHICFTNGRSNLPAIFIFSDIVTWYLPTIIRDENTRAIIETKKKFQGPYLQRSLNDLAEKFKLTVQHVQKCLVSLEKLGLIRLHACKVEGEEAIIEPNIERLKEISMTHSDLGNEEGDLL